MVLPKTVRCVKIAAQALLFGHSSHSDESFGSILAASGAGDAAGRWGAEGGQDGNASSGETSPPSAWRLTSANVHYALCPNYPNLLAVPASVTDAQLRESASR